MLRRDPRIRFLMTEWASANPALGQIVGQLVGDMAGESGNPRDIRIIDISGLPNEVAGPLSAMLARLLFQYKLYETAAERERDPVLLVCEEAHRYVPDRGEAEYVAAQSSIRRIAREGRKYGIGLMLVSQRPADVESTVISQCGTWLVLRLTNSADQQHVARFLPDGLSGMTNALPNLAQQEAIFVGEGAALPARVRIRDLPVDKLPKSDTAKFARGWSLETAIRGRDLQLSRNEWPVEPMPAPGEHKTVQARILAIFFSATARPGWRSAWRTRRSGCRRIRWPSCFKRRSRTSACIFATSSKKASCRRIQSSRNT